MEGCKNYTICGDPLFFAPEIVSQNGYDYAADLWALGVLAFEIYEGFTPFGTAEMEETVVFNAIVAYKGAVKYSTTTSTAARDLIDGLLCLAAEDRLGYREREAIKKKAVFKGYSLHFQIKLF